MAQEHPRMAARIRPDVDERLRLFAAVTGRRVGSLLTELLDAHLPTAGELADRIRKGNASDGFAGRSGEVLPPVGGAR